VKYVVPVVMAFVLAGQMIDFFGGSKVIWYVVAAVLLVGFFAYANVGKKSEQ
jgi:hypothetical protein